MFIHGIIKKYQALVNILEISNIIIVLLKVGDKNFQLSRILELHRSFEKCGVVRVKAALPKTVADDIESYFRPLRKSNNAEQSSQSPGRRFYKD